MFSLIITIISIALVAALAVATVYYGGNQFNQGNTKAAGSAIVTSAQQIAAANTLLFNDQGAYAAVGPVTVAATCAPTDAGCFPTSYLKSIPKPPAPAVVSDGTNPGFEVAANNVIELTIDGSGAVDVCSAVNKSSGLLNNDGTVLVPADEATFDAEGAQYGCYGPAVGPFTFKYLG